MLRQLRRRLKQGTNEENIKLKMSEGYREYFLGSCLCYR